MAKEIDKKKLVSEISRLIVAELDGTIFAGKPSDPGYECKAVSFECSVTYNCDQAHSCQATYTFPAAVGADRAASIDVNSELSSQIAELIEKSVSELIDPIVVLDKDCNANQFECDAGSFDCGQGNFVCNNLFTG